ncbi:MAG: methyltransferase domain-containing protein [Candidatus Omnitrophota bacterium]
MRIRLYIGLFLLKVSYYLRRLYLVILTPRDLIESNKLQYTRNEYIRNFGNAVPVLLPEEKKIIEKYKIIGGKFLVLGCGGGREAIALAKAGFEVVGVDFIEGMVDVARRNAKERGLNLVFETQDISRISFPKFSFDYAGIFSGTYSSIPTYNLRIKFLKKLRDILKPNGLFILTFLSKKELTPTYRTSLLKAIGYLTLGNLGYQAGDELKGEYEFLHYFYNKDEAVMELKASGFKIEEIYLDDDTIGYVIARPR